MDEILVRQFINQPVDSNCFVLYRRERSSCIIIDPGTKHDTALLAFLEEQELVPEYILLTHEHFDHIAGVNDLKDIYNSQIVCGEKCSLRLGDRKKNMSLFYDQKGFSTYPADILVDTIDHNLDWQGYNIRFFDTPGHTDACISFGIGDRLFTGDCLIKGIKTVTKLPGGSKEAQRRSFGYYRDHFDAATTRVYPGHGPVFMLGEVDLGELI